MVLDEDTEIAANDVLQLLGTIKHPLNEAVIDDTTKRVLRGFGVVQPISRVSERSAAHWRYPEFLFGPIGAPKPGEQTAHQLQNLLGQSVFTGKGIIDLEAYGRVIAGRFPDNILLSHDHVEGAYLKTATDCRAFILEDAPTTAQSSSMRQHRWMRGEWHNILWLAPLVKVGTGGTERNPLELFHRWVLAESIRRSNQSLVLAALILLIRMNDARTFVIWSISIAVLLQLPAYVTRVLVIAHKIKEKRPLNIRLDLTDPAIDAHVRIAFFFITAGHDGLISLDAFLRSMFRLATGRRRLEWTSSSQSTAFGRQHRSFVFSAYSLTYISGIFLILIAMVEGLHAALSYLPIWLVWDCAPLLAWWLQLPARRLDSSTEQTHQ
jgi:cyclic beta-1,2-glucan synthetase